MFSEGALNMIFFHNDLKDNIYGQVYSKKRWYQNRNSSQTFLWDNFTYKNFKKLFLVESLFNITQDYSLQSKTILKSVTDDFMMVF